MREGGAHAPPLGLVAGHGDLPVVFSRAVRAQGRKVVAVGLYEEADSTLADEVDACTWRHVGQLGGIVQALRRHGVREACLLGGVRKRRWFRHGRPDWVAMRLLWSLARREDDALLRAVARQFERSGIRIVESLPWLAQTRVAPGALTRLVPNAAQRADMAYALGVCRTLGELDIGQCVAVRNGAVVALEAMEGTDACIARAGRLCEAAGLVVVKAAKPSQDMRFDVPTVGPDTIAALIEARAGALGLEAGRVMMVQPEATLKKADEAGLVIYGMSAAHSAQEDTNLALPAL